MSAVVENTPDAWTERATVVEPWAACGWSKESQEARFSLVASVLGVQDGETVLDYGCGTARFFEWLSPRCYYTGFDWSQGMRDRARRDHPWALIVDELGIDAERQVAPFDCVAAIGPFNLPGAWSKGHTFTKVMDLWRSCRRVMAVALYAGTDERCLIYSEGDLATMGAAALKLDGGSSFRVQRGYLQNDLLLVLRR